MSAGMAATADANSGLEQCVRDRSSLLAVKDLAIRLRRQQVTGSFDIAEATARTLRGVVSSARYWRIEELINMIRVTGKYLQDALPTEPLIGNITRRILFLLREEARAAYSMKDSTPTTPSVPSRSVPHPSVAQSLAALSLSPGMPSSPASSATAEHASSSADLTTPARSFSISDLVQSSAGSMPSNARDSGLSGTPTLTDISVASSGKSGSDADASESEADTRSRREPGASSSHAYQLKPLLIQAIQELIDELESVDTNVAKDAKDHIHSGEVVLTLGDSTTVQAFLRAAAKHRKFITVVPECAPSFDGHTMARNLSKAGLSVLLVPDSNLFALMPRISKVILGARCVLANGGILANVDAKAIAMTAREHSTPVVALAGVYKISPDWSWVGPERLVVGNQGPVSDVVNFAESRLLAEEAEIANPLWDYVPPSEIDVIITNVGEHPPSYVYRLIQENYDEEDM